MQKYFLAMLAFFSLSVFAMEPKDWLLGEQLIPEGLPGGPTPPIGTSKHKASKPAGFQPNRGQALSNVDFIGEVSDYRLYVTDSNLVFDLLTPGEGKFTVQPGLVTVNLVGANMMLGGQGENKQAGITNYLYGSKPENWALSVPSYGRVRYTGVYSGIDLVFYGNSEKEVEHDFIVSPGADYHDIKLEFKDAQSLILNKNGNIDIFVAGGGRLIFKKPLVYQTTSTGVKLEIPSHYELNHNQVSFWIDETQYDKNLDLVIDPVTLTYSSYLGGTSDDVVIGMTVDSSGNMFVAGYTYSSAFPTTGGLSSPNNALQGTFDGFVSKISSTGTLSISTYFGGTGLDVATSVLVDSAGNVYLAGYTTSTSSFPTAGTALGNPFSTSAHYGGTYDAFLARLSPSLTLLSCSLSTCFSAFLGGTGFDSLSQIAFDTTSTDCTTSGQPCVIGIGTTNSQNTSPVFITNGGVQTSFGGGTSDAFIVKVTTGATFGVNALNYYGGSGRDIGIGVAVETTGDPSNIYIAGQTNSSNGTSIASVGTVIASAGGARDGFVAKINGSLTTRSYGTYIGGVGDESVAGLALNPTTGTVNAYVIGTTTNGASGSFTATNGNAYSSGKDIFIAKLNSGATAFTYLTNIGGSGTDDAPGLQSIAVDSAGLAWFAGRTTTSGLTTTGAINSPGFSAYPSGATTTGLYGYISSASSATTYNAFSYFGNPSGTDLLSAVALKSGTDTTVYLGGYASEMGGPLVGTTTRTYGAAKDSITAVSSYSSDGCFSVSGCIAGSSAYINSNLFDILRISASASTTATASVPSGYSLIASGGYTTDTGVTGTHALLKQMSIDGGTLAGHPSTPTNTTAVAQVYSGGSGTPTVVAYSMVARKNGTTLSCCGNTSDIEIATSTGPVTAGSLTLATAILDADYSLVGGGAWVSSEATPSNGNFIFASFPSFSGGTASATTLGYKLSNLNCLYSDGLSGVIHTDAGGSTSSTAGGETSIVSLQTPALSGRPCNSWTVASREIIAADAAKITAYAIGIKNTILPSSKVYIKANAYSLNNNPGGFVQIDCDFGISSYTVVGGGGMAIFDTAEHYITQSYPRLNSSSGWTGYYFSSGSDAKSQLLTYCIAIAP